MLLTLRGVVRLAQNKRKSAYLFMSREVMYARLAPLLTTKREHMAPNPQQVPEDFGQAVEIYRQNYVQYKTTGRVEYKTAYETAQTWIERYLQSMEKRITDGRQSITSFVNENAGAGTTLGQLGDKMKMIKKEGPAAQDAYVTIKRINEDVPEDNSDLYVKAGIAAALVGVAGIMSVF
jgi:hypothetical protein